MLSASAAALAATRSATTTTTASGGSFVCYFPDGPASSTVSVQVKDSDNANSNTATQTVTVANVPPVITSITPAYGTIHPMSTAVNVVANFTDAGTGDTHTCTIDWDNGAGPVPGVVTETNGSGACKGNLTYTAPGVYTIKVKVVDDDGGFAEGETLVIVYDPSAGFVTGGGWINSPAGAYRDNLALTGRANFGFVSKYQKGATDPDGPDGVPVPDREPELPQRELPVAHRHGQLLEGPIQGHRDDQRRQRLQLHADRVGRQPRPLPDQDLEDHG